MYRRMKLVRLAPQRIGFGIGKPASAVADHSWQQFGGGLTATLTRIDQPFAFVGRQTFCLCDLTDPLILPIRSGGGCWQLRRHNAGHNMNSLVRRLVASGYNRSMNGQEA